MAAALYDEDFVAWLDAQVAALRERRFEELDLDNLIEEVEAIRRAELRSVEHHASRRRGAAAAARASRPSATRGPAGR